MFGLVRWAAAKTVRYIPVGKDKIEMREFPRWKYLESEGQTPILRIVNYLLGNEDGVAMLSYV